MRIVYIYTVLATVEGVDWTITERANYLAGKFVFDVYITDSQEKEISKFSLKVDFINMDIMFWQQYYHSFIVIGYYYFKIMKDYKQKLSDTLKLNKLGLAINIFRKRLKFHKLFIRQYLKNRQNSYFARSYA